MKVDWKPAETCNEDTCAVWAHADGCLYVAKWFDVGIFYDTENPNGHPIENVTHWAEMEWPDFPEVKK